MSGSSWGMTPAAAARKCSENSTMKHLLMYHTIGGTTATTLRKGSLGKPAHKRPVKALASLYPYHRTSDTFLVTDIP